MLNHTSGSIPPQLLLTLGLCVILGGFACYCSGYISAHITHVAPERDLPWISCFLFIAGAAFLYGALLLLEAATRDARHDLLTSTVTSTICLLVGLTLTLMVHGTMRNHVAQSSSRRSGHLTPWFPWLAFGMMAIVTVQQAYWNTDPQQALRSCISYEILSLCFLLTTLYGAAALIRRESTALIVFLGLLLCLLAPLIAGLSTASPHLPISAASWFLLFHLGGLIFLFLALHPPTTTTDLALRDHPNTLTSTVMR